ncbi:hypothetical protein ACRWSV_05090, partial [Escherichia coli]
RFDVFAGKKSAQIREILISESAWEEMTCLFAPSLINDALIYIRDECIDERKLRGESPETVIAIFNRELQNIFNQEIE